MNYYERHLGDYARDTGHLSLLEHGAYNVLLDRYYVTEQGIPAGEVYRVARANSAQERKAVDAVLAEFFTLEDGFYRKDRVEREIARYREKSGKASASAKKRWSKPKGNANADADAVRTDMRTHSDGNALQSPDTKHQTPEGSLRSPSDAREPSVPRETISPDFDAWVQAEYPHCTGRRVWSTALHDAGVIVATGKATEGDLRRRVTGYRAFVDGLGVSGPERVYTPQNFFALHAEDAPWRKEWEAPKSRAQQAQDGNLAASREWLRQSTGAPQ